jgi:aminopeptidase N
MKASRLPSPAYLALLLALLPAVASGQQAPPPTRADTLRGTVTPERAWWDVLYYDLSLRVSPADSSIAGSNEIHYEVVGTPREMQIDLQRPMEVDSIVQGGARLEHRRDGDVFFVRLPAAQPVGSRGSLTVHYRGRPRVAAMPPWDGGFVWARGPGGEPWVATAVQGIGASVWWPNKDHQADEPDSMRIRVTVPQGMTAVSNGRLESSGADPAGTTFTWRVTNPINNYGVAIYAGNYVHFGDRMQGEAGPLDLDYWVLEPHLEQARRQFEQAKPTIACFEEWFGPYPFYEDGFKMVESPYLGMEHQSAIAYGNQFRNGYLGRDWTGVGISPRFDFIIVHESGHEWFGNSITANDVSDAWIHEGFTTYAEGVYVECLFGREDAIRYVNGYQAKVANEEPIIGPAGVNHWPTQDQYFKGALFLHTLRHVIDDDAAWWRLLRDYVAHFQYSSIWTSDVITFFSTRLQRDMRPVFEQYLYHAALPVLELQFGEDHVRFRWDAAVEDFDMPVQVRAGTRRLTLRPTREWQAMPLGGVQPGEWQPATDLFYIMVRRK